MTYSDGPITLIRALAMRVTVARAIKVGLIVGTLLVLLNHGDGMAIGEWPPWWKVVLTYLVPYSVSSYSTAAFLLDLSQQRFCDPVAEGHL